jgi:hypothetical protein
VAIQGEVQKQAEMERRRKCQEYNRKKEKYERNIDRGVNIPGLKTDQMRRVKQCQSELFKSELNPILEKMTPKTDEHKEWMEFKGVYEKCIHQTKEHILLAIERDSNRL